MNYYERHLGDYARDAGHLSMLEHGAYTLLLDRYYTTEQGIPQDQAHRVCRARSREERAAVDTVLAEFFVLADGVWTKGRVEREITKVRSKAEAARTNGRLGGRPKKNREQTEEKPTGFPTGSVLETQPKALQSPVTSNHEIQEEATPLVDSPPLASPQRPACPTEEIVSLYHGRCPTLPRVTVLNDARRRAISSRWREVTADADIRKADDVRTAALEWWGWFFGEVQSSDFLAGRSKDWHATLDWLMKPTNFVKVVDGNFANQRRTG